MIHVDVNRCKSKLKNVNYSVEDSYLYPTYELQIKIDGKEDIFEFRKSFYSGGWVVEPLEKNRVSVSDIHSVVKVIAMKMGFLETLDKDSFQKIFKEIRKEHENFKHEMRNVVVDYSIG